MAAIPIHDCRCGRQTRLLFWPRVCIICRFGLIDAPQPGYAPGLAHDYDGPPPFVRERRPKMPKGPRNGPVVRSVIAPASPPAPVSRPTSAPAIEAVAVFPPPESPALDAALALPHEVRYEATLMELAHLMRLIVRLGTEAKQSGDTDYLTDLRGLYRATDSVRNFYEDMADGGWHDD